MNVSGETLKSGTGEKTGGRPHRALPMPVAALIVFGAYYGGAKLGLALSFMPDYVAPVWPPNAVLLAALMLVRPRDWWWLLAASVPAELLADIPGGISFTTALAFVGADWVEALVAAIPLRFLLQNELNLETARQTWIYLVFAVMVAPVIAAFPGAATVLVSGSGVEYAVAWRRWALGDALTHLVFTPLIISWVRYGIPRKRFGISPRKLEAATFTLIVIAVCFYIFGRNVDISLATLPMLYIPLPLLVWGAVRFGPRGVFTSASFVALVTIWSARHGAGPFSSGTPEENVLAMQFYLGIAFFPVILLSAVVQERRTTEHELRKYRDRLEVLVEERTGELREAQGRLLASERLAVIGKFAGSIAHEIRNPLSVISNSAYLLSRHLQKIEDEKINKNLGIINSQVTRTSDIIDSIMRLARMEAPQRFSIDLAEIMNDAVGMSDELEKIDVKWQLPGHPVRAEVDPNQFDIAVKNIVRNAAQAMPDGGVLTVELRESPGQVTVTITDTGNGITPENIERVFEPLYSTKAYGIGFGLPIVKMIVERHGGEISVNSEPGRGTTVSFTVPSMKK